MPGRILPVLCSTLIPLTALADNTATDWQSKQLFRPSESQLAREQKGRVTIYDGLTEADVNRAMDQQYGRIENMMFTRVVKSDDEGNPEVDTVTGEPIVEDDGCD